MKQKKKTAVSARKRKRRLRRKIRLWMRRIVVLTAAFMVLCLLLWGGFSLWRMIRGEEEAPAIGARIVETTEKRPGVTLVVVDAGHGGKDQGTSSGDVLEKDINLSVAFLVAEKLEERGADVLLTRSEDVKIDLEERAVIANEADADLFVSIHCNYCEDDASVKGLECYYRDGSEGGQALAEQVVASVEEAGQVACRGTRTADFRVLRKTDMPAILVELGYLSNRGECGSLTDKEYQELLADKIVEGIL